VFGDQNKSLAGKSTDTAAWKGFAGLLDLFPGGVSSLFSSVLFSSFCPPTFLTSDCLPFSSFYTCISAFEACPFEPLYFHLRAKSFHQSYMA
jgi:hypothetical protein